MDFKPYLNSFEVHSSDFKRITEFVEPVDENLDTYSHRIYELYLRACTDFESVCKESLQADGYEKLPDNMNIYDYKNLEDTLSLEEIKIGVLTWRPKTKYLYPLKGWSKNHPPLDWYSEYNKVKHNRNEKFSLANLNNLTLALSGLFSVLYSLDVIPDDFGYHISRHGNFEEYIYPGYIFSACIAL